MESVGPLGITSHALKMRPCGHTTRASKNRQDRDDYKAFNQRYPRHLREIDQPMTPDPRDYGSKRAWESAAQRWREDLRSWYAGWGWGCEFCVKKSHWPQYGGGVFVIGDLGLLVTASQTLYKSKTTSPSTRLFNGLLLWSRCRSRLVPVHLCGVNAQLWQLPSSKNWWQEEHLAGCMGSK